MNGGTPFKSSQSDTIHRTTSFLQETFAILDDDHEKKSSTRRSIIWTKHNMEVQDGGCLGWASETDLYEYVKDVLRDVFREAGLKQLSCLQLADVIFQIR